MDWKTGRSVTSPDEERAVAVQLAAYRLAWATLPRGVPVADVRAAFYYVREDVTVRAADPARREYGLTENRIETIPPGLASGPAPWSDIGPKPACGLASD